MTYYVYQLQTTRCRKYYIGITNDPDRRLRQHKQVEKHKWKTLTSCGRAVKRYGAHTFTMRILETVETRGEAVQLEITWIARFSPKRLWNSSKGGEGGEK